MRDTKEGGNHETPFIQIPTPAWDADAPSPLTVSGQSDTFEGNVQIRVYDRGYHVVGSGVATGGSMGTQPPGPPATYVVQPGDTLYRLARRFGTTIYAIANANNIANVNLIYVGQKLVIP